MIEPNARSVLPQELFVGNPCRVKRLIEQAIAFHALDLRGLTVYTETGSRNCMTTPIIAAMAGASRVTAIVQDSEYGKAAVIADYTNQFAEFCGAEQRVEVVFTKTPEAIGTADIVTNLGFVRPIDRQFVGMMKRKAVVPLMYESWECRSEDVDLAACREREILVAGTNEDFLGLDLFTYAGPICMKMLFEVEVEVYRCTLAVFSRDKFGERIASALASAGAEVGLFSELTTQKAQDFLGRSDALILADYAGSEPVIGREGQITASDLSRLAPSLVVVLFAGVVHTPDLRAAGVPVYPDAVIKPHKMYRLFADLGPKPHVDLMAAGLKVGELLAHGRDQSDLIQNIGL